MSTTGRYFVVLAAAIIMLVVAAFVPYPWEWSFGFGEPEYPGYTNRNTHEEVSVRYYEDGDLTFRVTHKKLFRYNGVESWSLIYPGEWDHTRLTSAHVMMLHRQYEYITTTVDTTCMEECGVQPANQHLDTARTCREERVLDSIFLRSDTTDENDTARWYYYGY